MFKYVLLVGLVLVVVAGGGYYNYVRNAPLDAELAKRPHKGLSTPDLLALIAAYEGEATRAKKRVAAGPGGDTIDRVDPSDLGGKADSFAAFQRQNEGWKRARGFAMEQEFMLKELRHEKSIRDRGLDTEYGRIKRRVLTF